MTFCIRSIENASGVHKVLCELTLGEHRELFPLLTTLWTPDRYRSQWIEALHALVKGEVEACILVTDIQPPDDSFGMAYWALFREGDHAYFQERFTRELSQHLLGSAKCIEAHIPPRVQGTPEEHSVVSEWIVPIQDLRKFVASSTA